MKVTTKVAAGAAVLLGLLLVVVVLNVTLVRHLASAHRTLSEDRFTAVTTTLELLRTLELIEERLLKLSVTRDQAYRDQIDRLGAEVEASLETQRLLELPPAEKKAVETLLELWREWRVALEVQGEALVAPGPLPGRSEVRTALLSHTDGVRAQSVALLQMMRKGIETDVETAVEQARQGERTSGVLALVALGAGIAFVVTVFWSLNGPLARLINATRSVGAGRYTPLAPRGSDELSELARAFDRMVERLDEVDRMKRDFVWSVSHELKTPLSAMQETSQLLADELAGPLTPKQKRMLALNIDAGRRLSGMLSRMLDLSRLEAGAVTYDVRPVDLRALVQTALLRFEARLLEQTLDAQARLPESPLVIHGDADWLSQVVENLLENAIKFSPPNKRLTLSVATHDGPLPPSLPASLAPPFDAGRWALVQVEDEGPGIPSGSHEHIFERFFQVDRKRRVGSGVGLGLAICKDVVQAHAGAMWVTDSETGGCVFHVALPRPAALQDPASHPEPTTCASSS